MHYLFPLILTAHIQVDLPTPDGVDRLRNRIEQSCPFYCPIKLSPRKNKQVIEPETVDAFRTRYGQ